MSQQYLALCMHQVCHIKGVRFLRRADDRKLDSRVEDHALIR